MAVKSKKESSDITYKIDSRLMDNLYKLREKLKNSLSVGGKVAGLCLLGEKEGIVDTFIPMISSRGCWDAPTISYTVFDAAFRKMIKKDRTVIGMSLIRPNGYDSSLPADFRSNILGWKNIFPNILKTIWIVVSEIEVKPYSMAKDAAGRFQFIEYDLENLFSTDHSKIVKIAKIRQEIHSIKGANSSDTAKMKGILSRYANTIINNVSGDSFEREIDKEKEIIKNKIKERALALKKQKEAAELRKKEEEKQRQKMLKKQKDKEKQVKAGMKDSTDIGGGYFLIKDKNGKEILWKR